MTNSTKKIRANGPHYRYANVVHFESEDIREIILELIDGDFSKAYNHSNKVFIDTISHLSQNDITWLNICEIAELSRAYRLAAEFTISAAEKNILIGKHSDTIRDNTSKLLKMISESNNSLRNVMCFDEIEDLLVNDIAPEMKGVVLFDFDSIKDEIIKNAYQRAYKNKFTRTGIKPLFDYLKNISNEEIDYFEICDIANKYRCYNIAFYFIYELLINNEYQGTYAKELYSVLPEIKKINDEASSKKELCFCGKRIKDIHLVKPVGNIKWMPVFIEFHNEFLKEYLLDFFTLSYSKKNKWTKHHEVIYNIENCLSNFKHNIHKPEDFTMQIFWSQINWFKNNLTDAEDISHGISYVLMLYRMLITNYPEHDFLKDCTTMNKTLLFSYTAKICIDNNYHICPFDPANIPRGVEKLCLLLKGMDKYSTKIKVEDFRTYDISSVKNEWYRDLMIEYLFSIPNISYLSGSATLGREAEGLALLVSLKSQNDYPNKSFKYITNQEAVLIRETFALKYSDSLCNRNDHIGCIRRFFNWCKLNQKMNFDDLVFDYLKDYEKLEHGVATAVPEEHIAKISTALINRMSTDHMARCCYVIMNILITTQFRIGHILGLTTDSIRPTAKPNQFRLYAYHKTGHGSYESFTITERVYKLLVDLIEDTEIYREKTIIEADKKYIFLSNGNFGIKKLKARNFSNYIENLCKELGLPKYNASNFRDTHMTMALEHALKTGKSDAEFSTLTGHRHIDTTKSHYIDWNMEAMLEATYGLNLDLNEYVTRNFEVADKLPEGLDNKNSVVQNGCGNCKSDKCVMKTTLPCLICEHFITTPAHEPYFVKAIEELDKLIETGKIQHDVEDLITTKKLHVMYLDAIYKHLKEAEDGNNS